MSLPRMLRSAILAAATAAPILLAACGTSTPVLSTEPEQPLDRPPHSVLPVPREIQMQPADSFSVTPGMPITVPAGDEELAWIGRYLADLVGTAADTLPPRVVTGETARTGGVLLAADPGRRDLGPEGYELDISRESVSIVGATPAGVFYGVQTLRQLMPASVEYDGALPRPVSIPAARVVDGPRFAWRGAMLDVARHFLPAESVKRYIDHMALHKLNRLHLHLSDDQGWRIEIKSWPALAEIGGSTEVGGGPGGYYTQEEYADIVAHAQQRYITVVPEIDMPGHTNAALASYPELNCDGVAPPLYTGIRVGFSALCVEKEITYEWVDDVVREISALTPGPYFHIGGDEVEELTDEEYRRFIERAEEIVRSHGKTMIGWGEVAPANLAPESVIQYWRPHAHQQEIVAAAAARGNRLIFSPADRIYLDMRYHPGTALGLAWAGHVSVRDAYDWEPAELLEGVAEEHILGIEAPLWSETVVDIRDFEYMAFPRLAAVAEVGWSAAENREWETFRTRLGAQARRWAALGINFYRAAGVPWQE